MKRKKRDIALKGSFLWLVLLLCLMIAATYLIKPAAAAGQAVILVVIIIYYAFITGMPFFKINSYINRLPAEILNSGGGNAFVNSPFPIAVVSIDGTVMWTNETFIKTISKKTFFGKNISEIFSKLDFISPDVEKLNKGVEYTLNDNKRSFMIYGIPIGTGHKDNYDRQMYVLYFNETTEYKSLSEKYKKSRPVVGLIVIDNYDEIETFARGRDNITISVEIDKRLSDWAVSVNALFRSVDNNKYIIIFEEHDLMNFRESKFDILDSIRKITMDKNPVTISIGIGSEGVNFAQNYEFATQALDMALGRGGDQAVIKTKNNYEFFGGKSKAVEKRTKVKSRVIADSLVKLMESSENVLIMGHKYSDFDSLGACVGIARIAKIKNKRVNIVINKNTTLAMPLIEKLETLPEYQDVFVDSLTGLDLLKLKTLLVICDVHSPQYLEYAEIYKNAANVVVIDHHRKMADYINNAVINYHEPYASSTSEIVTELVQYIDGENTMLSEEAEALMAGIILDTKNFCFKTGFRTFEAAAYLRKFGADPVSLKKIFRSDFDSFVRRTEFIQSADFYKDNIAISVWNGEPFDDAKAVMSQAADELLSIEGVEASFVLYTVGDSVHISSRSLGSINVQFIMENLGGGGHMTNAGAQIQGTLEEAKTKLIAAIDKYLNDYK